MTSAKQVEQDSDPINYDQRSIKHYLMSVAFFILAFIFFIAVWAINKWAIKYKLASSYY